MQGVETQPRGAQLEAQVAMLREALEKISSRHAIVGSTGDYRKGQIDALNECRIVADSALAATESTAAEYRRTIENEALERAKQVCLKGDFRVRHMGDLDATYPEIHTPLHACVALAERIESLKG
jgi:hypothetical protein